MPRSRERGHRPRRVAPWWLRGLVVLVATPAAIALLTAADASPSPTPSPTPSEQPGTLRVVKTDLTGAPIVIPGARFQVHRNTPTGQLAGTLTTNNTGRASIDLPPGRYCIEEVAAPPGFRAEPTYTPDPCVLLVAGTPAAPISVADPPAATPTPSATPSPTPSPTPVITGELQVIKVDTNGQIVSIPGFTFNIRVGSAKGQVIATINTDRSGTAVAGALNPAVYCVEEVSAPDGYQMAPTYTPSNCAAVGPDPSQGDKPTTITVSDPPAPTPTPSDVAGAAGASSGSPSPRGATGAPAQPSAGIPMGAVSKVLVGFGVLLLIAGGVMIVLAVRRRRLRAQEVPADIWYDSTIT